jgi:hypothetical protein
MAAQKPVVRHFIACDRVEVSQDGRRVSLVNVVCAIRPFPGAGYPRIHPELWLFAQMTDGQGAFDFEVELLFSDDDTSIFRAPPVKLDFGDDPLAVRGWAKQLSDLLFEKPGLYEFRLLCDGEVIAREPILLRQTA